MKIGIEAAVAHALACSGGDAAELAEQPKSLPVLSACFDASTVTIPHLSFDSFETPPKIAKYFSPNGQKFRTN